MAQPPSRLRLRLANGALLEAPIYEKHQRGTNYLAIIDIDPTMPGGLGRRFAPRGRGDCMYMTESLGLFDAVEFGADYTTNAGNKHRNRWYGVIMAITDDFLIVESAASGSKAVLRSKEARISPEDRANALRVERDQHIVRAAELEAEIAVVTAPEAPVPTAPPMSMETPHETLHMAAADQQEAVP